MASRIFHSATTNEILARPAGSAFVPAFASELGGRLVRLGDALAYTSGIPALVGGAMTWAVGRTLASPSVLRDAALVACGAFVVYNVDRLRDLARDGTSSPRRSAFVARNRDGLVISTGLAALVLFALLAAAPIATGALVVAIGAIGLLHRRLKQDTRVKIAYVAAAWTVACVGLPSLARVGAADGVGTIGASAGAGFGATQWRFASASAWAPSWALGFVGAALLANLIASNLREGKGGPTAWEPLTALLLARGIAIAAVAAAAIAPEGVASLAWVPAAEAAALCCFRETERFGHLAVDGALLLGALIAICGVHV